MNLGSFLEVFQNSIISAQSALKPFFNVYQVIVKCHVFIYKMNVKMREMSQLSIKESDI